MAVPSWLWQAFDAAPVSTWVSDDRGTLLVQNEACRRVLRITDEEVVGKYNLFADPVVQRAGLVPLIRTVFDRAETVSFTLDYDTGQVRTLDLKDRVALRLAVRIAPVVEAGRVVHAVVQHTEVADPFVLHDTERRIRETEQQYRVLVESSPDGIVVHKKGRIVFANQAALRLFGAGELSTVIGIPVAERIHPDYRDAVFQRVARAVASRGALAPAEEVLLRLDGTSLEVEVSGGILDQEGSTAVLLVIRPLTEQKRAQAEHRSLLDRYRILMETNLDGLHVLDADGVVLEANPAFCRLVGRPRDQVIGLPVWAWDARWSPAELQAMLPRLMGRPDQFETRFRRPDGTLVEVEINAVGIPWDGRQVLYASARDLTERRRVEAELAKNQKLESLGLLAGGIAHDFNNILGGIQGQADLVRLALGEGKFDKAQTWLDRMYPVFDRGKGLTRRLLTFSRGGEPVRVATPVEALLRETTDLALVGSDLRAVFRIAPGLAPWDGDPHQIGQVFHNLIINARQASPAAAELVIEAGPFDERTILTVVRDAGAGIAAEDLPRVFDPFFSTKKEGTGLGLTVAHSIVRRHGGRLELRAAPGGGTEARVWLPAAQEVVAEPTARQAIRRPPEGLGLVVLEDNRELAEALEELGSLWGSRVRIANDGRQVLAWDEADRRSGRPADLFLLDQMLPGGLGGLDTARELRRRDPRVKVLLMSGFFSGDPEVDPGDFARIAKPFTVEELTEAVLAVLAGD